MRRSRAPPESGADEFELRSDPTNVQTVRQTRPPEFLRVNIVTVGESGSGKTSAIRRFVTGRFEPGEPTVGVDFVVHRVSVTPHRYNDVLLNIWDLSGIPESFEVRNEFYPESDVILLFYDLTSAITYQALDKWLAELAKFECTPNLQKNLFVLVATKVDLDSSNGRVVERSMGENYARKNSLHEFFEISAATGEGLPELFERIVRWKLGDS